MRSGRKQINLPGILLLIAVLLPLLAGGRGECADWVVVLEDGEGIYYADRVTADKLKGHERESRELSVMKKQGDINRYLECAEYDCREKKRRVIQLLTYHATGEARLKTTQNAPWTPAATDPKSAAFLRFVCGR